MEKKQLVKEITGKVDELSNRVYDAISSSAQAEGRMNHNIAHSISMPLMGIAGYFRQVCDVLEHPEVDKTYSWLRFSKRLEAGRATKQAKYALSRITDSMLQNISASVDAALQSDVEGAIMHVGHAFEKRNGEKFTASDEPKLAVMRGIIDVMMNCSEVRKNYDPTEW